MSVLLGLDVQLTRLGWATADLDTGAPRRCGAFPMGREPAQVRHALAGVQTNGRFDVPDLVYVEGPYVGPNRMGSLRHAMVIGQVVQACDRRWPYAPVVVIPISDWKRACDLPGNASKAAVFASALMLGFHPEDQDAADAACIAYAGWVRNVELLATAEHWS